MQRLSLITTQLTGPKESKQKSPDMLFKKDYQLVEVLINNPKALNSLTSEAYNLIISEMKKWEKDKDIQVAIFKGVGGVAFSAGGDVKALMEGRNNGTFTREALEHIFTETGAIVYRIKNMDVIQISFWDGIVMGIGAGISVHSKIKIATEKAKFAMPETKIGLITDHSGGSFLSRLNKGVGIYMALTGRMLLGEEIVQVGLADYFVSSDKLQNLEDELRKTINQNEKVSLESLKKVVEKFAKPLQNKFKLEDFTEKHFFKDNLFDIMQSLQNAAENENDKVAEKILKEINDNCPKSVRVTFELLKRGKLLNLKDELAIEIPAHLKMISDKDFIEGVHVRLVTKSNQRPNWTHKSVYDVKEEEVQSYFNLPKIDVDEHWKLL